MSSMQLDPLEGSPAILRAALRQDLGTFVMKVFQTVSPGDLYIHNWHVDAITHELIQVHRGENRRLIITQPPRSLKSICSSVAFPAWSLGHDPSKRFACVSYSQELGATFARQFRSVVASNWYRELFPQARFVKDTETETVTSRGGGRFAVPVEGSFTGRGADVIVIDDPLKADDALSDKIRTAVNEWYATTLISRLDDKMRGAIILVMQRLHEDDLAGKLLTEGGWRHLDLPAIALEDETIRIGTSAVHCRFKGEALHPAREPVELLDLLRREMGSITFSAQYLQRPVPIEGNLIKRNWMKWYSERCRRLRRFTTSAQTSCAKSGGGYTAASHRGSVETCSFAPLLIGSRSFVMAGSTKLRGASLQRWLRCEALARRLPERERNGSDRARGWCANGMAALMLSQQRRMASATPDRATSL